MQTTISPNTPPPITIDPPGTHSHSVIWLHGLGADGYDFLPIVDQLPLGNNHGLRFIFPHAPEQPVTINNGYVMRAWYDIIGPFGDTREDEAGVLSSEKTVLQLINHEIEKGISSNNIFLAGFSQGGAIALFTGLRYTQPLAGILALSTYLPLQGKSFNPAPRSPHSIFMAHGIQDPIIPFNYAKDSYELLHQAENTISWHSYPMEHSVCPKEIIDISDWFLSLTG